MWNLELCITRARGKEKCLWHWNLHDCSIWLTGWLAGYVRKSRSFWRSRGIDDHKGKSCLLQNLFHGPRVLELKNNSELCILHLPKLGLLGSKTKLFTLIALIKLLELLDFQYTYTRMTPKTPCFDSEITQYNRVKAYSSFFFSSILI